MKDHDRRAEERFKLQAKRELFPKMRQSDVYMAIATPDPDPKFCLELGTAIMMDKPVIALVIKGQTLSSHLRRVADHILEVDDLTNSTEIAEKLEDIMRQIHETENTPP